MQKTELIALIFYYLYSNIADIVNIGFSLFAFMNDYFSRVFGVFTSGL